MGKQTRSELASQHPQAGAYTLSPVRARHRDDLAQKLVGSPLPAITLDGLEGILMTLPAAGRASVGDQSDEIADVAGRTHRSFDALVRHHTADDEIFCAE